MIYKKAPVIIMYETAGKKPRRTGLLRILPIALVTVGSLLIANVTWPIVSYLLISSPQLQKNQVISPLAESETMKFTPTSVSVEGTAKKVMAQAPQRIPEGPEILSEELDYTNLTNWFPNQDFPTVNAPNEKTYTIDIPALKLKNINVQIGSTDLSKGVVQYPGTANPGELGAAVVFGHSTNPLFYAPSEDNPKRYMSIFTKLMDLKKDDKITVTYDGVQYIYRVIDTVEVQPDDLSMLAQRRDTRELRLITCTPVGTYLRRGVIVAQLDDIQ